MKTNKKVKIRFDNQHKSIVRNMVLRYAKKTEDLGDFYGTGGMYDLVKRRAPDVDILSIDTGHDFKNKKELKKTFLKRPGTRMISFRNLAKEESTKKATWWLDYCGSFSNQTIEDIHAAPKVMKRKGYVFITLQKARECFMSKGTSRKIINKIILQMMEQTFKEVGIKVKLFWSYEYKSIPRYEGREKVNIRIPMETYGFRYVKK